MYPGDIHQYSDIWVANIWDSYRCLRIFCQAIRIQCIAWLVSTLDYKLTADYIQSYEVIQRLVDEICAIVPFHLGSEIFQRQSGFTSSPRASPCGDNHWETPK